MRCWGVCVACAVYGEFWGVCAAQAICNVFPEEDEPLLPDFKDLNYPEFLPTLVLDFDGVLAKIGHDVSPCDTPKSTHACMHVPAPNAYIHAWMHWPQMHGCMHSLDPNACMHARMHAFGNACMQCVSEFMHVCLQRL